MEKTFTHMTHDEVDREFLEPRKVLHGKERATVRRVCLSFFNFIFDDVFVVVAIIVATRERIISLQMLPITARKFTPTLIQRAPSL